MSERFGFEVKFHEAEEWDEDSKPGWAVSLPHQCDGWDIAGDSWGTGVPQADAVAALERFVGEAQEALAALREGRTFGGVS